MRCTCAVYGCTSASYSSNDGKLQFHRFPKDENRCRKWITACHRPDLRNKSYKTLRNQHVCGLHFEKEMYSEVHLKVSAIPTINLPLPERSISTQTDNSKLTVLLAPPERSIGTQTDTPKLTSLQDVTSRVVQFSGNVQNTDFVKKNKLTVKHKKMANKGNEENLTTPLPRSFDLPEANAFLYICGYIFRRCVQKHKCIDMVRYASSYTAQPSLSNLYIRERAYNKSADVFASLQGVPDDFLEYCNKLEKRFCDSFMTLVGDNIGENMYNHLTQVEFSQPCDCFPLQFLIRLYVKMRIHYIVKFNNRILKSKNKCCKYLSVQHL